MADSSPTTFPITCPVTRWYFKRMAFLGGMLLAFGVWFFIDGKWTWPADNEKAAKYEWFQKEVLGGYDTAKKDGKLEQWISEKKAAGYPLKENGEPEKWASYAAKQGWPEKPKRRTEKEIADQFYYSYAMFIGSAIVGLLVLINRRKALVGHADHLITPEGQRMNYADAFKIDKRPWDIKGLAYVYHRPGGPDGTGVGTKVTLDDLKYDGTAKVLDQLMTVFRGELIEKVREAEAEETTEGVASPEKQD